MNMHLESTALALQIPATDGVETRRVLNQARPLYHPTPQAIDNTVTCFAGTEIALANEAQTNPVLNEEACTEKGGYGELEWAALLRKLDRMDSSYRN
jgi:hypothetical protein